MVALLSEDRASSMRHPDAAMDVLRSSQATYPAPHRALWALLRVVEDDGHADEALTEVKRSPATVHRAVRGEKRAGLDHVGFLVASRADLEAWEDHLRRLGVKHSPITDQQWGSIHVFRDPDNIQLELLAFA